MARTRSADEAARQRLLSAEEAALRLGIGRTQVYVEMAAGRLESRKIGRRRLIAVEDLEAYIDRTSTP